MSKTWIVPADGTRRILGPEEIDCCRTRGSVASALYPEGRAGRRAAAVDDFGTPLRDASARPMQAYLGMCRPAHDRLEGAAAQRQAASDAQRPQRSQPIARCSAGPGCRPIARWSQRMSTAWRRPVGLTLFPRPGGCRHGVKREAHIPKADPEPQHVEAQVREACATRLRRQARIASLDGPSGPRHSRDAVTTQAAKGLRVTHSLPTTAAPRSTARARRRRSLRPWSPPRRTWPKPRGPGASVGDGADAGVPAGPAEVASKRAPTPPFRRTALASRIQQLEERLERSSGARGGRGGSSEEAGRACCAGCHRRAIQSWRIR